MEVATGSRKGITSSSRHTWYLECEREKKINPSVKEIQRKQFSGATLKVSKTLKEMFHEVVKEGEEFADDRKQVWAQGLR